MIRFACPRCQTSYDVPDDVAGRKTNCRKCGQRLQVPALPNKTVLAPLLEHKPDVGSPSLPPAAPPAAIPVLGANDVVPREVMRVSVRELSETPSQPSRPALSAAAPPISPGDLSAEQLSRRLSLAGAIVLTLGVFCPVLQVPLLGGISLLDWGLHGVTSIGGGDSNERNVRGQEDAETVKKREHDSSVKTWAAILAILALCNMAAAIASAFDHALGKRPHLHTPSLGTAPWLALSSLGIAALALVLRLGDTRGIGIFLHVGWGCGILAVGIGLLFVASHCAQESEQSRKAK